MDKCEECQTAREFARNPLEPNLFIRGIVACHLAQCETPPTCRSQLMRIPDLPPALHRQNDLFATPASALPGFYSSTTPRHHHHRHHTRTHTLHLQCQRQWASCSGWRLAGYFDSPDCNVSYTLGKRRDVVRSEICRDLPQEVPRR